jgi:hypothetical protein
MEKKRKTLLRFCNFSSSWQKMQALPFAKTHKGVYHCSTQVQLGSMHSAPAEVGDE